jgi:2-dehydropantoate 2-reductase
MMNPVEKNLIGIMGAGSIGCFIGANLLRAAVPAILIGRESLQTEIAETGLKITDFRGNHFQLNPEEIPFSTNITKLADCAIVLITLKSGDTGTVAAELQSILKPKTIVVSFQNGVQNAEILKKHLPACRILTGMVPYNVVKTAKGTFHNGTSGDLLIAQQAEVSEKVVELIRQSGLAIDVHPNMMGILWGKLVFNLNNAINALAGIPLKEELAQKAFRQIVAEAMREALQVMKKAHIKPQRLGRMIPWLAPFILSLPDWLFFRVAAGMVKIDPQARSSMWEDLERGRLTEIDYLNGEIVHLGQQLGLPVPINQGIVKLIKSIEGSTQCSPKLSAEMLKKYLI